MADSVDNDILDCKLIAWKLYNKYIRAGSEFEINIGSLLRRELTMLLNDEFEWIHRNTDYNNSNKLLSLFIDCNREMMKLLI